jgi:hypothetical protein
MVTKDYHINTLKLLICREKTQFVDCINKSLNNETDVTENETELDKTEIIAAVKGLVEDSNCGDMIKRPDWQDR